VLPTADRLYEARVVFLHVAAAVIQRRRGPRRLERAPPFTSW
jgi:hypothetical protein